MFYSFKPISCLILVLTIISCASKPYSELHRKSLSELTEKNINTQVWQDNIGNGVGDSFSIFYPLVIAEVVFMNSFNGEIVALNLKNGKRLWQKKLPFEMDSSIGGDFKYLFVGDVNGVVHALEIPTGKEIWQTESLGEISSAPQSDGKILIVRTTNGNTFAFDVQSGKRIWQHNHKHLPFSIKGSAKVKLLPSSLIISTSNGDIINLDKVTGKKNWFEPITFSYGKAIMDRIVDVDSEPYIEDDYLYSVSMRGKLAKLNLKNGATIWNKDFSSNEPVTLKDNLVIASHEEGFIEAFDKNTGKSVWKNTKLTGYDLLGPVSYKDYLMVAILNGNNLFWLKNGKIISKSQVRGSGIISLTQTKLGILVYNKDGKLSLQRIND